MAMVALSSPSLAGYAVCEICHHYMSLKKDDTLRIHHGAVNNHCASSGSLLPRQSVVDLSCPL